MAAECSIWLLPAANQERQLQQTIAHLSTELGGEVFAPHVTIQGDIDLPWTALTEPLGTLAARMPVQRWSVQAIERSEHFFRCLYLRFAAEPAFDQMQASVQTFTKTATGLSPYPHLSLAYDESQAGTAHWGERLSAEFMAQEIVFDRLSICRSSKTVPIVQWENLAVYPLTGT
jgi:2'-5' RNA ligase